MSVGKDRSSRYNRRIRLVRKVPAQGFGRAGKDQWGLVANLWAEVQDVLPSRSERVTEGLPMATGQCRIRFRWRQGVTSDMRIIYGARVMEIVGGPAEFGLREEIEVVAQDYSTAGGAQ